MTLMRLLIGGSAVFTPPAPPTVSPYTLNSAPDGAMNPWCTNGNYSHGGVTIFSWNDSSGNVEVGTFDEATKTVTGRYTLHAALQADAHALPTLCRRSSDGKILAVYGKHNDVPINIRVSTNADDPSAWSAATNLDSQLGGTRYTDQQLYEVGGKLYLFYRDEPTAGTDSRWCWSKNASPSTPTTGWTAQAQFYRISGTRSYLTSALDAANSRIWFVATNGGATSGGITGFSRIGVFYFDCTTETFHKLDGTSLTTPIAAFASITQAYAGTTAVFPSNIVIDGSGYPVIAAQDWPAGVGRYVYVRWSGAAWVTTNYAAVGTGYEYSGAGTGFGAWGSTVRDSDPNVIYAIRDTGGNPEVYRYETADGGATFSETQETTGSTSPYQQLVCVRGDSDALQVICQQGSWTNYTNYNVGLVGLGL